MPERNKILVVGDLMLDRRIEGEMDRISGEAPCAIVRARTLLEAPGGAGNLAANLAALYDPTHSRGAAKVRVLGVEGDDPAGRDLCNLLTGNGCAIKPVYATGKMTTVKTRITCAGVQVLRIDGQEDALSADGELRAALESSLHENSDFGAVVLSDYNRGALSPEIVQWITGACGALRLPLFVDAKPTRHAQLYHHATVFKCNLREAVALAEASGTLHPALIMGTPDDRACTAARALRINWAFGSVVVTMGADGCLYYDGTTFGHIKTRPAAVYDVAGAGDTFMAALVTSLMRGFGMEEACKRANVASAIAISQHGTYSVNDDEWQDAIEAEEGWVSKFITLDTARDRAARKRRQGKKIVLTNGCFDLLHHGHLHLLAEARACGDVLFVACNTDESVRALKGPDRPVIEQAKRLTALARFAEVDYVFPFDGDVDTVVRAVHPDVLVKGAEYRGTNVPGADLVARHGGELLFASMAPGYSTTEITRAGQG